MDLLKANKTYIQRAAAVGLILFSNAAFTVYVFPYLYQIVQGYGLASDNSQIGFYGGLLGGCAFLGRGVSSVYWGKLADKKGRIPTLLISFCLLAVLSVIFNHSSSFMSGLVIRALCGASVAGVQVVGRVMMTEVAPAEFKATAIGIASSFWMIGTPLGLFLGGHYVNFFPTNPYLMISILLVGLFAINVIVIKLFLVETLVQRDEPARIATNPAVTNVMGKSSKGDLEEKLLQDSDSNYHTAKSIELMIIGKDGEFIQKKESAKDKATLFNGLKAKTIENDQDEPTYERFYQNPTILRGILAFSTTMFFESIFTETLPLWLCVPYEKGGLEQDAEQIGNMMGLLGIPQFLLQVAVYPLLSKAFGDMTTLVGSALATIPIFFLIPLTHELFSLEHATLMKFFLGTVCLMGLCMISLTLSALQRILNDSVQTKQRGEMNGALTLGNSVFQMLGPFLGGSLIQWSVNSGLGFPFNHYFLFAFCSVVCGLNLKFCISGIKLKKEQLTVKPDQAIES